MDEELSKWIKDEIPAQPILPLCHTTTWDAFSRIFATDKISALSTFGNQSLVYLFYGVPYYRIRSSNSILLTSDDLMGRPVGLILNETLVTQCSRAYPFDTGALIAGLYDSVLENEKDKLIELYVTISDGSEPARILSRYYGTTEQYIYGGVRDDFTSSHSLEKTLLKLLGAVGDQKFDERHHAIELHHHNDIGFEKNIKFLILPQTNFQKSDIYDNFRNQFKEKILYYVDTQRYDQYSDCIAIRRKATENL